MMSIVSIATLRVVNAASFQIFKRSSRGRSRKRVNSPSMSTSLEDSVSLEVWLASEFSVESATGAVVKAWMAGSGRI